MPGVTYSPTSCQTFPANTDCTITCDGNAICNNGDFDFNFNGHGYVLLVCTESPSCLEDRAT